MALESHRDRALEKDWGSRPAPDWGREARPTLLLPYYGDRLAPSILLVSFQYWSQSALSCDSIIQSTFHVGRQNAALHAKYVGTRYDLQKPSAQL
jgi:hypothetical protein